LRLAADIRRPQGGLLVSTGQQTSTSSWIFAAVSRVISWVSRYLAEDPVCGVEVGALMALVDEGLLRRNASVLAL
jgi:hypothetical protein